MSGLVKPKKYDWKDSNLALFGSDTEKKVKREAAETEPAWQGAGEKPGIQIWRIQKFKVVHLPKDDYGKFYNGDSYIILNTYKKPDEDELLYDVHFWIGQYSTQDEYGTAAYKTVELDTLLNDKPVQHREVMNHESTLFKSYFKALTLMEGGCESGFRHVKPQEYKLRLLLVTGNRKNVSVKEVSPYKGLISNHDVFILDNGLEIYQWNGSACNKDEKFKAVQYVQSLKSERPKARVETLDEKSISTEHRFYSLLHEGNPEDSGEPEVDSEVDSETFPDTLFKLSDEGGSLEMTLVSEGSIPKEMLNSADVFIADTGKELFVWIGKHASDAEKKNGLSHAHNYLMSTKHPLSPVTVLQEGQDSEAFSKILS